MTDVSVGIAPTYTENSEPDYMREPDPADSYLLLTRKRRAAEDQMKVWEEEVATSAAAVGPEERRANAVNEAAKQEIALKYAEKEAQIQADFDSRQQEVGRTNEARLAELRRQIEELKLNHQHELEELETQRKDQIASLAAQREAEEFQRCTESFKMANQTKGNLELARKTLNDWAERAQQCQVILDDAHWRPLTSDDASVPDMTEESDTGLETALVQSPVLNAKVFLPSDEPATRGRVAHVFPVPVPTKPPLKMVDAAEAVPPPPDYNPETSSATGRQPQVRQTVWKSIPYRKTFIALLGVVMLIVILTQCTGGSSKKSIMPFGNPVAMAAVKNCQPAAWLPSTVKAWQTDCISATKNPRIAHGKTNVFAGGSNDQFVLYNMIFVTSGGNNKFKNGLVPLSPAIAQQTAKEMGIKYDPSNGKTSMLIAMRRLNDISAKLFVSRGSVYSADINRCKNDKAVKNCYSSNYVNDLVTGLLGATNSNDLKAFNNLVADWYDPSSDQAKVYETALDTGKTKVLTNACHVLVSEHKLMTCPTDS